MTAEQYKKLNNEKRKGEVSESLPHTFWFIFSKNIYEVVLFYANGKYKENKLVEELAVCPRGDILVFCLGSHLPHYNLSVPPCLVTA